MSDQETPSLEPQGSFQTLSYVSYLKIPELLDLQAPLLKEKSHDELLFIIIHQAYELWFKLILHELDTVARLLEANDIVEARRLVERCVVVERVLVDQIHILETMTPRDFCHFRGALRPASGFQSTQFREVEFLSGIKQPSYLRFLERYPEERARLQQRLDEPSLRDRFYAMLRRLAFDIPEDVDDNPDSREQALRQLVPIYTRTEEYPDLYHLCEALVSHDQWLGIWRFHHVRVVERIIGAKPGTGGSPGIPYLESTLSKRAFPLLWAVRGYLDEDALFGTYVPPS